MFFPIYLNTLHGIRTVDPQLVEMGRIYGMIGAQLFRRVILPGALPSIFVGLRYALGIMWLTLIVAETIAASSGIGYMAMQAREFLLIDVVVLSILIYALLGKLADSAARLLERLSLAWHPAFQKHEESACKRPDSRRVEPVDAAALVEQARSPRRLVRPGPAAHDPRVAQIVRRQRGAARHRPRRCRRCSSLPIVGRSGCGKSTLLRLLAGLDRPDGRDHPVR